MANCSELKDISNARLKSARILMTAKDWEGAGYMFGYVLECMLKAVICKTLNLKEYPDTGQKDSEWFLTHRFDRLLRLSGLESIFSPKGSGFSAWSGFTQYYAGEWPAMRYEKSRLSPFTAITIPQLYNYLICDTPGSNGIITIIKKRRKC
jgi:hypothetical protein